MTEQLAISLPAESRGDGNDTNLVSPSCSSHSYEDGDSELDESLFDYPYEIADDPSQYENYDEMVEEGAAIMKRLSEGLAEVAEELEENKKLLKEVIESSKRIDRELDALQRHPFIPHIRRFLGR